jgi:hypothetical protein
MKLPYKKFLVRSHPGGPSQIVTRPVIPIRIRYKTAHLAYETLVDSGADYSIFHAEIGETVGIKVRTGARISFSGVSGHTQTGFRHPVELELAGRAFSSDIVFAYGLGMPYGILGQAELFKRFIVVFDRESGWLDLKPRRPTK